MYRSIILKYEIIIKHLNYVKILKIIFYLAKIIYNCKKLVCETNKSMNLFIVFENIRTTGL